MASSSRAINYGRLFAYSTKTYSTKQATQGTGQQPFLGKCQWCYQKGNSWSNCSTFKKFFPTIYVPSPNRNLQVKNAQAHLMAPQYLSSPNTTNWLFDSRASFHATNDLNNLSIHAPYNETEELVIGDGWCLQISHIGSVIIQTPHTPFILKNVLYVPSLSRNIITTSRICIDKNFLIEFNSFVFVIKDLASKTPLFKGTTTKGMYELCPSLTPQVFAMHSIPLSTCHHRLGHPQNKV